MAIVEITPNEIQKLQGTRNSEKAPWETWDEEMGDTKLSPELKEAMQRYEERRHVKASAQAEEELAKQRELSAAVAGDYQWIKPEEYEKIAPKIGHIMHSSVFINNLRTKCGVKCWYSTHPLPKRLTLLVDRTNGMEPPEIACWCMEGFCPEYSIMRFDDHGIPLDERMRGWRTPLLQLILKGIVTENQASEVFGEATGPASVRFNSLIYEVRNQRVKAKEE